MTVTYISNILNHHVFFIAQELYRLLGDDFCFIEAVGQSKKGGDNFDLGFAYMFADCERYDVPWRMCAYKSEREKELCRQKADNSDVVITSNVSDLWIQRRLAENKLTFRAHERWYGKGFSLYKYPKAVAGAWLHHGRFKSLYMLCASAYTRYDTHRVGCFDGKSFKWGYFPQTRYYQTDELFKMKSEQKPTVLWSGRFVDWKRAQDALTACSRMLTEGFDFSLKLVGFGPEERMLRSLAEEFGLSDIVEFCGLLLPDELRTIMEKSDIYLMTSDFQEGWGAVLNEAMNSGCAVIASHAAGAAPYLIDNGKNGFIYECKNTDELTEILRGLLSDRSKCRELGLNAYKTIANCWNAEFAAKSFIELSEKILNGQSVGYDGEKIFAPCTAAPVIKNNWYAEN